MDHRPGERPATACCDRGGGKAAPSWTRPATWILPVWILCKLTALNEQGTSIILITHDNHLAQMAKRIVTIQDGRIISDTKGGAV
ncbi:MAG: hypothetical protein ACLRVN_05100 [Butyricicoccus sp.]